MGKRRKRRSWSDDEKREICQQTTVPVVSVAQVARRFAMNANMIHTWLKDPRFAPVLQPIENKVRIHRITPRHLRNRHTRRHRLRTNLALLFVSPKPLLPPAHRLPHSVHYRWWTLNPR